MHQSPPYETEDRPPKWLRNIADRLLGGYLSRLENEKAKWRESAETDPLTGMPNRGRFDNDLEGLVSRHERTGETFSVMIMDIDYFKHVNDTYGHKVGDEVLKQVAGVIEQERRRHDGAYRIGGEEFVMLLNTDENGALTFSDRLRSTLAEYVTDLPQITVSAGVAEYRQGIDILETADRALYFAKNCGRNQVVSDALDNNYKIYKNNLQKMLKGEFETKALYST